MSESLNLEVLAGTADSLQEVLLSKKSSGLRSLPLCGNGRGVEILHIAAHTDQGKQGSAWCLRDL